MDLARTQRMRRPTWRRHDRLDQAYDWVALIFIVAVAVGVFAVPLAYRIGVHFGAVN